MNIICVDCGITKDVNEFEIHNKSRKKNQCRECYRAYCRAYRKEQNIRKPQNMIYTETYEKRPQVKKNKTKRICLSCGEEFISQHKFNRLCWTCKKVQRNQNTYEPVIYSVIGR